VRKKQCQNRLKHLRHPKQFQLVTISLDQVKELIELISEKQFTEFELERGSFRMRLGRGTAAKVLVEAAPTFAPAALPVQEAAPVIAAPAAPVAAPPAAPAEENLHILTSPIVGTYYQSASPTNPPFAEIGAAVKSGQTLCIVEAMKLMNEIQSDVSGTVAKIFVENGQPVEYGQPLFGIKI
jgi:acetyl-CoA carboxylase biotin carboxyl carrier protein